MSTYIFVVVIVIYFRVNSMEQTPPFKPAGFVPSKPIPIPVPPGSRPRKAKAYPDSPIPVRERRTRLGF